MQANYWELVEPIADEFCGLDGAEFEPFYASLPDGGKQLCVMHYTDAEIANGGFAQYFHNTTGVFAPEAVVAFNLIGESQLATIVQEAIEVFGNPFPRTQILRQKLVEHRAEALDVELYESFEQWDDRYFANRDTLEESMSRFAAKVLKRG